MPKRTRTQSAEELRLRDYCVTLNNYTNEDITRYINQAHNGGFRYLILAKEVGSNGTPHLQGFFCLKDAKTISALQKTFKTRAGHLEARKGTFQQARDYCLKGNQPKDEWETQKTKGPNYGKDVDIVIEHGTLPMDQQQKGELGKQAATERWELAKKGRFEELPPEQIKTYEYIRNKELAKEVTSRPHLTNIWVVGDSGVGKSRYINENFNVYDKDVDHQWWDGYEQGQAVLFDDVDDKALDIKGFKRAFKRWTDHYPFTASVKGSMMKIRPPICFVTSQYSIYEVAAKDPKTYEAWKRRFHEIDVNGPWSIDDLPENIKEILQEYLIAQHTRVGGFIITPTPCVQNNEQTEEQIVEISENN